LLVLLPVVNVVKVAKHSKRYEFTVGAFTMRTIYVLFSLFIIFFTIPVSASLKKRAKKQQRSLYQPAISSSSSGSSSSSSSSNSSLQDPMSSGSDDDEKKEEKEKKEGLREDKKTKPPARNLKFLGRSKSLPNIADLATIDRTESILGREGHRDPHFLVALPNIIDEHPLQKKEFKDRTQDEQKVILEALKRAKKLFITHIGTEIKQAAIVIKNEEKKLALRHKRLDILKQTQLALAVDTTRGQNGRDLLHRTVDGGANIIEDSVAFLGWLTGINKGPQPPTEK
jgi:hypothetical protein